MGAPPGSGGKDAGTLTDVAIDGAISVATGGRARNASSVKRAVPRAPAPPQRKAHDFSSHEAWKRDYTASRAGGDVCPCFGAGTSVETAEGPRPIETVRVGDLVLSRDEATGETGYQPVTEVFITPDKEVLELTVTGDDGDAETLVTTPGHPFWVDGQGWVTAAELRVGEVLMTAEQGLATLSAALSREGRRTVYNLEVEGWHTYFVGEAGAWVHNACRCGGGGSGRYTPGPNDLDWRGRNSSVRTALDEAFKRTGVARDEFTVTRWGRDAHGKSFPVEWRAQGGAEVNIDLGHAKHGPDVPHVGFQSPGNRSSGGAVRGHILLDDVPVNR